MKFVYQIQTYTGAVLDYTITKACPRLKIKSNLTGQLGHFSFSLPGRKGSTKCYDDIALKDIVKIYLASDGTIPANPLFTGVIENIDSVRVKDKQIGFLRTFSGRDQGEVMTRLRLRQYSSAGDTAHNTVDKIASRCGLGTTVDADATAVTIVSHDSRYDAYLKEIGDYAGSIDKDWYIDAAVPGNLVWKARPIRTTGVSTLTIGRNISSYTLTRSVTEVYNKIWVFGATETFQKEDPNTGSTCSGGTYCAQLTKVATDIPPDHDSYSDAIGSWTAGSKSGLHTGPLAIGVGKHCGSNYINNGVAAADVTDNEWIWLKRSLGSTVRVKDEANLNFWAWYNSGGASVLTDFKIYLDAPDTSNYFTWTVDSSHWPGKTVETHYTMKLGPGYEVQSGTNDGWVKTGDPDWYNLDDFKLYFQWNVADGVDLVSMAADCLYFNNLRWSAYTSNPASITSYGAREIIVADDRLHSNTACSNYAALLLAQKKDPSYQLDVVTPLDTNILIGDRIPITIADENLAAVNFDVISVEHSLPEGLTHAVLVSNARCRELLKITSTTSLVRALATEVNEYAQRRKTSK